MKSPTFTKFMQYLLTKNNQQGFTIWELLFVIVIIGILSAIALPSFVTSGCACNSNAQAKTYVGSLNRAQQAYFSELGKFSPTINQLETGIQEETEHYKYSITITENSAFNYGIAKQEYVRKNNFSEKKPLHSFVGGVFIIPDPKTKQKTTITILCQNDLLGTIKPNHPILKNGVPTCGEGTTDISKNTKR